MASVFMIILSLWSYPRQTVAIVAQTCSFLLRLPLRLGQNRQIGVGVLPHREKSLISFLAVRHIAYDRQRARQSEIRERVQRRERRVASVIENLLKLRRRFRTTPEVQIRLTAQVLPPEFGGGFIAGGCLQLIYRLRRHR
jgi:hypothetical protein